MINAITANNHRIAHLALTRYIPAAVISGGGTISGATTLVADTVADLRTVPSASALLAVYAVVKGGTVAFDGYGGDYIYDVTCTDADDGNSVIRPFDFTTAGAWRKHV